MPKDVENKLLEYLQPVFEKQNFKLMKHLHQFRKTTANGFLNTIVSVSGREPVLVEINIGTRIDLVEELAYQFTTGLRSFQENSNTLITSMGRIMQQPYFRFEVHQSVDIREVAEQIKAFMETQGFDFLEKYSTISELDKLFNDKPREKLPYAYNHLNRCLRGIVLARMADRKDFPAIAATYRNTLLKSSTAPPLLEKYDKLVNHLKTFSFN
jgi:hypothetical protein